MRIHGILCIENYIERQIRRIDDLNVGQAQKIILRIGAGLLPAFLGSVLLGPATPVSTLAALACLYLAVLPVQQGLFELTASQRHTQIGAPAHFFFIAWAALLYFCGNAEQIGRTVGPLTVATAVALWPIYMSKKAYAKKQRKVPFATAYWMAAGIIGLQQLAIISGEVL